MQPLTGTVATAFARMGVPAELVAWVLADIARPQGVDRLLTACADVRLACLEFQARPNAPMVGLDAQEALEWPGGLDLTWLAAQDALEGPSGLDVRAAFEWPLGLDKRWLDARAALEGPGGLDAQDALEGPGGLDAQGALEGVSSSTEMMRPAFVLLDQPVELVACVLSKLERPEYVNRLLVTCQSIRRACLALQGGEGAGADAPMVVQVVSISREVARPHGPFRRPPNLCLAVKNGWVALLPLL